MLWLIVFLVLPGLILIVVSFAGRGSYGELVWEFSLENYKRLLGFGIFGWTPDYLLILMRSVLGGGCDHGFIGVALLSTLFFYCRKTGTNTLYVAHHCHYPILDQHGYPDLCLVSDSGTGNAPCKAGRLFQAHFTGNAVVSQCFRRIPGHDIHVSSFCGPAAFFKCGTTGLDPGGGGPGSIFLQCENLHARHPAPDPAGLSVGVILTLVPAMGMFVVPDLLGGAKYMLVGNLIQQQFGASRDWAFGAAISMGLMVLTMLSLYMYQKKKQGD